MSYRLPLAVVTCITPLKTTFKTQHEMIVYVSNVGIISVLRYNQVSVSSQKGGLFLLSRELCTWQTENVN